MIYFMMRLIRLKNILSTDFNQKCSYKAFPAATTNGMVKNPNKYIRPLKSKGQLFLFKNIIDTLKDKRKTLFTPPFLCIIHRGHDSE